MRFLTLLFACFLALPVGASDYAREKKWADEVLPSVLTGDPVWLEISSGHKFLTLYTEAGKAKAGVIVVHGMGVHPDWGLIAPLRQQLPEKGYATLSVQMPVLKADAKQEEYPATFEEAAARIKTAVDFMAAKGYSKIVLVTHSMGCRMTARYLELNPGANLAAWVAIGAPAALDYSKLKFPVLDLYGENDLPQVLKATKTRAKGLRGNAKSAQMMAPKADHFFEGKEAQLLEMVQTYLDKTL
jgi:triacylglycerol esterase/lipase EstA (alpha/beta hydrolase family)